MKLTIGKPLEAKRSTYKIAVTSWVGDMDYQENDEYFISDKKEVIDFLGKLAYLESLRSDDYLTKAYKKWGEDLRSTDEYGAKYWIDHYTVTYFNEEGLEHEVKVTK